MDKRMNRWIKGQIDEYRERQIDGYKFCIYRYVEC